MARCPQPFAVVTGTVVWVFCLLMASDIFDGAFQRVDQFQHCNLFDRAICVLIQPQASFAEYAIFTIDDVRLKMAVVRAVREVNVALYEPSRVLQQMHKVSGYRSRLRTSLRRHDNTPACAFHG